MPKSTVTGSRPWLVVFAATVAASALLGATATEALAASDIGRNIGNEIDTWAKALMLGTAALVAIPILAKRDVAGGAVIGLLVVVVGGFAFAPGAVKSVISGLWKAIGA